MRLERTGSEVTGVSYSLDFEEWDVDWSWDVAIEEDTVIYYVAPMDYVFKIVEWASTVNNVKDLLRGAKPIWVVLAGEIITHNPVYEGVKEAIIESTMIQFDETLGVTAVAHSPESEWATRASWTDCQGEDRETLLFIDFPSWYQDVSTLEAREFLESGPDSVAGAQSSCRWFHQDGNNLLMLEGYRNMITSGAQVSRFTWNDLTTSGHASYEPSSEELFSLERIFADEVYDKFGQYEGLTCHMSCFGRGKNPQWTRVPDYSSDWLSAYEGSGSSRERRQFQSIGMVEGLRLSEGKVSDAEAPWDHAFAENVMGLQSVLYTYRLARDNSEGRGNHFNDYWGSLPSQDPGCGLTHERRCRGPVLGDSVSAPSGEAAEPFEVRFLGQGSLATLIDVMAVQGVNEQLSRYWHFEDEGDSTDTRPHGVESSMAMADESLDLLNDVNPGGKGVAVGLSHEWIGHPDPSIEIRDEQGHFRHNYQGSS